MKRTWCIVQKDFAALRGPLALWFGVMLAKFALGIWIVRWASLDNEQLAQLQIGVVILVAAEAAFTMLIAALLVQEDGVAGTAAFWRTRPVARSRLLAAKALGAVLFLVMPALAAALPWWRVCGFGLPQIAEAALDTAALQIALIVAAFAAAAVTTTIGRCMGWGLVALVAVYSGAGFATSALRLPPVALALLLPLMVAVMAGAVVVQFLAGRRLWALALLAAGGVVTLAAPSLLWKMWGSGKDTAGLVMHPPPEYRPELARSVALTFESASVRTMGRQVRVPDWLRLQLRAEGLAPELGLRIEDVTFRWRWPGDPEEHRLRGWSSSARPSLAALRTVGSAPAGHDGGPLRFSVSVQPLPAVVDRLQAESPEAELELRLEVARPEVHFALAVTKPEWKSGDGRGARVLRTTASRSGSRHEVRAELLESEPFPVLGQLRRLGRDGRVRSPTGGNPDYVIRNADGARTLSFLGGPMIGMFLGGVQVRTRALDVSDPVAANGGPSRPDWLDTVELTAVAFPLVSARNVRVPIPRLDLKP